MNDLACQNQVVIPVVHRSGVSAVSRKLKVALSGWDSSFWRLQDWYREG
jgi:peptide/nickel transport system substrate-binding protein